MFVCLLISVILFFLQIYIDPKTLFEFRSSKDALRYLKTGDISCVSKPKKRLVRAQKKDLLAEAERLQSEKEENERRAMTERKMLDEKKEDLAKEVEESISKVLATNVTSQERQVPVFF